MKPKSPETYYHGKKVHRTRNITTLAHRIAFQNNEPGAAFLLCITGDFTELKSCCRGARFAYRRVAACGNAERMATSRETRQTRRTASIAKMYS